MRVELVNDGPVTIPMRMTSADLPGSARDRSGRRYDEALPAGCGQPLS